ncbi:MAG: hypothetical protein K9L32_11470, partial [Chromatiaceae bacterium]|nr:hypothetical protein [Chromatiaceae bacterium]
LAMAVIHRLVSWKSYGVRTLDEAFKVERPGIRLKDRRRRLELQHMVYGRVQEIIYTLTDEYPNGPPLECAYEQVAEELGIGTTLVDELYRSINTPMTHARERYRQSGVADEAKAKILREGIEAQNKIHAEMLNLPSWLIAEYLAIHQPE